MSVLTHEREAVRDEPAGVAVARPAPAAVQPLVRRIRATDATVYLAGSPAGRTTVARVLADVSVAFPTSGPHRRTTIAGGAVCLRLSPVHDPDPRSWPAPARGVVVGALVLVDPGRYEDVFALLDHLEAYQCPFAVAVGPGGTAALDEHAHRAALAVGPDVPVVVGDWHDRDTVLDAVARLGERALAVAVSRPA